jgi:hypothetical protein
LRLLSRRSRYFQPVSSRSSVLSSPQPCNETETRMPFSGDKTNILLLLKHYFSGQSDEIVFVFFSRLEDALIVIAETTPCRHDLRLRELFTCPKNNDCKVTLFLCPLCLTVSPSHRIFQLPLGRPRFMASSKSFYWSPRQPQIKRPASK